MSRITKEIPILVVVVGITFLGLLGLKSLFHNTKELHSLKTAQIVKNEQNTQTINRFQVVYEQHERQTNWTLLKNLNPPHIIIIEDLLTGQEYLVFSKMSELFVFKLPSAPSKPSLKMED
jgi:hypothetical protein